MVRPLANRWREASAAAVLLAALLAVLLSIQTPLPAGEEAKAATLPSDLARMPGDAVFLLSARVADLWHSDVNKAIRAKLGKEVAEGEKEFEKHFGLPIERVERLSMVMMDVMGPAEPLLFVRTTEAYPRDKLLGKAKEETYKGKTYFVREKDLAIYPLDERSVAYGNINSLRILIDHPAKSDGNLTPAVRLAAGKHSLVCGFNVKAFNDTVGARLPGEVEPFRPLLEARYGTLALDVAAEMRADVKLIFASEKEAQTALKPARTGLDLARAGIGQGVEALSKQKDMANFVELLKQLQASLQAAKVEQEGQSLQASARLKIDTANTGVVMLQAIQKMRGAAARTQGFNNLRQLALAMHNYHDTMGQFPPQATWDKNGRPMLSWRVFLLPYIEQQELYKQFHLNEPWDSEHNKKLLAKMPRTYASPDDEKTIKDHTTYYQGFYGKGAIFEGKKGIRIQDITDGTSNTFMIVEASKAVPWTKPEDIPYDPAKPLPKLGRPGAGGFSAATCDGAVRFFSDKVSEQTLRNAITRDDGNPPGRDF